jgi:hypothetical protein
MPDPDPPTFPPSTLLVFGSPRTRYIDIAPEDDGHTIVFSERGGDFHMRCTGLSDSDALRTVLNMIAELSNGTPF